VGTGALVLAAAGLLEGLGATSRRQRWVQDGRFITSAGGSAGIDYEPMLGPWSTSS
jgi:transcriptional regulator GlxA family with amidase domain